MLAEAPFNAITGHIIGAAIEVHRILGPGLLESTYLRCLLFELGERKLRYAVEQSVPVIYKGVELESRYRVDLIVEDLMVVEVKSVEALSAVHQSQVLTYLSLTGSGWSADQLQRREVDGRREALNQVTSDERRRRRCA